MAMRYPGGFISSTAPTVNANTAKGVWTLEEAMQYIRAGQWPVPTGGGDPFFQYNTMLLPGQGTNGAQNNTFLDSSTNNFTITRNGNTTQGTFTPFSGTAGNWSNFFDGTSSYLTGGAGSGSLGSGNFTVEAFVYATSTPQAYNTIFSNYTAFGTTVTLLYFSSDSKVNFVANNTTITSTAPLQLNTWNHVAAVRNSGTITLYVNGVAQATLSYSGSSSGSGVAYVGTAGDAPTTTEYSGFISNLRVVAGSAVYTSAFTPPTSPLTAISNTIFLTCQSNRFVDNSTNAYSVTSTGSPSVTPFQPFGAPTTAYSASTIGGSGYFDGTGDYLTATANNAFNFGTGDFTVEGWIYPVAAGTMGIWANGPASAGSFGIAINSSGRLQMDYYGGTSLAGATNVPINAWSYFAFVRTGSTLNIYLNGVRDATTTTSSNNSTNDFALGLGWTNITTGGTNGYISGFRISDAFARYTGTTMTVPTAPTVNDGNTTVLCNFTNAGIIDNAQKNDLETVGTSQISTSQYKFGTSSIYFNNGETNPLVVPNNQNFNLSSGDFTIESWVYVVSNRTFNYIISKGGSNTREWAISVGPSDIRFYWSTNGISTGDSTVTASAAVPLSTWSHVAVIRTANTIKIFLNGNQVGSGAFTSMYSGTSPLYVGRFMDFTGISHDLNGYLADLRITKGYARYPYNFTAPTAALPLFWQAAATPSADPYFDYTTLLLPGNGTNGAQNNTFLDSSTNAFTITRNGNTTQGTFTPFSQTGWSNYFDGSGDYLVTPSNAAFGFGTGDATIEAWLYPTTVAGTQVFLDTRVGSAAGIGFYLSGATLSVAKDSTTVLAQGGDVIANAWNHVVWSRQGTSNKLFLNGVETKSVTDSTNYPTAKCVIGISDGVTQPFTGYISNVRVVKGTAVYTGTSFTVPTSPLTAVTNTQLLTCQSNRFIDNSTNAFTITRNGDTSVQAFSPFNPTASYSTSTVGGSGYFDGSGDYLATPNNAALTLGTNNFTIEMWVYCPNTATAAIQVLYDQRSSGGQAVPTLYFDTNGTLNYYVSGSNRITSASAVSSNTWNHIAVERSSGTTKMYVNGAQVGSSYSDSTTYVGNSVGIGAYIGSPSLYFSGYISSLRVVNGTAVYSGTTFTPPTAPPTAITNTSLLLNYTNGGIIDNTAKNNLETVGGASISTAVSKFGGSSMYFDGTTDCLFRPTSPNFGYGTGDFTIEFWLYLNAVGTQTIVSNLATAGSTAPHIYYLTGSGLKYFTASADRIAGPALSTGTWYHIAISRYSSSTRMFVNGSQVGSTYADSNNYDATAPLGVGDYGSTPTGSNTLNGYINDLRVTKGIARYTTNFTPPATAFLTL